MPAEQQDPPSFQPKSTLEYAARVGLQAGAIGLFVSTIQNALGTHSHGAMGVFTRTGGTIGLFSVYPPPEIFDIADTSHS